MSSVVSPRAALLGAAIFAFAALPAGAQQQSGRPTRNFPVVGAEAPDFSATATDSTGRSIPVTLSSMHGKVVVLAFYPLDRSSGCTAEMSKFRDEYATLFGSGVVVLPTSVDTLGSHASWAKDAHFPFAMIADPKGEVATKYASQGMNPQRPYFSRTVFVVGKDGKISYEDTRFNALAQDGYDKLAAAVKEAKGQ
jgi:peroxiredoxin Q/BCP